MVIDYIDADDELISDYFAGGELDAILAEDFILLVDDAVDADDVILLE